jgi:hypothetical protein
MPFPFYPGGVVAAVLVLAGTFAVFRTLLLALDRGAAELRGSIGPGLVRGVRAWAEDRRRPDPSEPPRSPRAERGDRQASSISIEDLIAPPDVPMEAVRTRRR